METYPIEPGAVIYGTAVCPGGQVAVRGSWRVNLLDHPVDLQSSTYPRSDTYEVRVRNQSPFGMMLTVITSCVAP